MGGATRRFTSVQPSNFATAFSRASLVLEGAVLDLLSGGWDEDLRKLTHHMAGALRQAARDVGWGDQESALRAIESLVELSAAELLPIREAVGSKLLEFFTLLKKIPTTRSA